MAYKGDLLAIKKMFMKRAARGKHDRLLVNFGEHWSSASGKRISDRLSGHRGVYVMEEAEGIDSKEAKELVRKFGSRVKSREWQPTVESQRSPFNRAELKSVGELLGRGAGRLAIAEVYNKRELRKLEALHEFAELHEASVHACLVKGKIGSALKHFNDSLGYMAEAGKIRNSKIARNLARMKGNVLARYGAVHSTLSRDLKASRPDAEIAFDEKTAFSHRDALIRAKLLGKARNPPKEILEKALVDHLIFNMRIKAAESLKIAANNPKLELFLNSLTEAIPPEKIDGLLGGISTHHSENYNAEIWVEVCRLNRIPWDIFDLKPEEQLSIMRAQCKRVYGENSKLFRIAYREA